MSAVSLHLFPQMFNKIQILTQIHSSISSRSILARCLTSASVRCPAQRVTPDPGLRPSFLTVSCIFHSGLPTDFIVPHTDSRHLVPEAVKQPRNITGVSFHISLKAFFSYINHTADWIFQKALILFLQSKACSARRSVVCQQVQSGLF